MCRGVAAKRTCLLSSKPATLNGSRPRKLPLKMATARPDLFELTNYRHSTMTKSRHGRGDALHRDGASERGAKDFNSGVLILGRVSGAGRFPEVCGARRSPIAKNGLSLRSSKAEFLSHHLRLAWQVVRAHRTLVSAGLRDATMGGSPPAPYAKIHTLFSPRARAGPWLARRGERGPEGG